MGAIAQGLTFILAKISAALGWIGKLFIAVFLAGWDFIRDAFAWVFEEVCKVAIAAVGAIDVSGLSGAAGWWGSVPAEVLNIAGLVGIGEALGIIFAAILIRITLQLIPFVRLGS
jgi:hypothetical protein